MQLNKLSTGDQVAIISPSNGLPEIFPWVQDLGLKRLTEDFGLIPKEYPTTRKMNSPLCDRARDIMAAFADPVNKAVFASIGGLDQIKLIKYLDLDLIAANPKPFFGYSDNTHLHNVLWNLGIPSYYGGHIMTDFGYNQFIDNITANSIRNALFNNGEYEIEVSDKYNDIGINWADKGNLDLPREFEDNEGLYWDGDSNASGILWGGCADSLIAQVAANKYLPKDSDMDDVVLFIETSEDMPDHWVIEYLLIGFGERGWLNRFSAVLVGRPKAWNFDKQNTARQKADYKRDQREMILCTIREYNQDIPIVQNLDFGHTTPQLIVPSGNIARIDSKQKRIFFNY